MKIKPFKLVLIIFSNTCFNYFAQEEISHNQYQIDSLQMELKKTNYDTAKIRLRYRLGVKSDIMRIGFWDTLEQEARDKRYVIYEARALNQKAILCDKEGLFQSEVNYLFKGLKLAREVKDHVGILSTSFNLAHYYLKNHKIKESLEYSFVALNSAEQMGNRYRVAGVLAHIGRCFYFSGAYEKATSFFIKTAHINKELGNRAGLAHAYMDIGTGYIALNRRDIAIPYYLKCKQFSDEFTNSVLSVDLNNSIGSAYTLSKQNDSAIKYCSKAYTIAKEIRDTQSVVSVMACLAEANYELGDYQKAKQIVIEAFQLLKRIDFKIQIPSLAITLKKLYIKDGNYREALEAYELSVSTRDSLTNEKEKKKAFEKEFNYNIEKKESENKLLSQQNQIQSLQLSQNRYFIIGFGVLAFFISIIAWLILRQNRLRAQQQSMLLEQKLISSQMNPHFIFNSLNSIQQLIMSKENEKAEYYLSKFSKLIRELLESNTKESLSIEEEVGILKGYIEMEARRFSKAFIFSVDVDEKVNQRMTNIPHMMVQPFVENAIWHGLLPKDGDRSLTISFIYVSEKTIKCIVEDNGVGRKASKKRVSTFKKKSLALSFIQQRLELMSETLKVQCSVNIIDKLNAEGESLGTRVELVLPCWT